MHESRGWRWWLPVLVVAYIVDGTTHTLPFLVSLPIFIAAGLILRLAFRYARRR